MSDARLATAIVDYGMGNLFSVRQACLRVGLDARLTQSGADVLAADLVIIPGVGAFGEAMRTLAGLDLVGPIRDAAAAGTPLVGVCLGMQLLMDESDEFGSHSGLGLIRGNVSRLTGGGGRIKVPHIGWNSLHGRTERPDSWARTPLAAAAEGTKFYFVHSYRVASSDPLHVISTTTYEGETFCSSISRGNVFGCQFHPERSGAPGLRMYRQLIDWCGELRTPAETSAA